MAKKYNDESKYYRDWTTAKLKQEAINLDELIYKIECYGTNDVTNLIGIELELQNRGVEFTRELSFN